MVIDQLIERIFLIVLGFIGLVFIIKPSFGAKILNKIPFNRATRYFATKKMSEKDKQIYFNHQKKYGWIAPFIIGLAIIGLVVLVIYMRGF